MKTAAILLFTSSICVAAPVPRGAHTKLSIQDKANVSLDATLGRIEGNDLKSLPRGEQTFNNVPFEIGKKLLQTRPKVIDKLPEKIEGLEIKKTISKLHILQACTFGNAAEGDPLHCPEGKEIGEYVVHYADGTTAKIPIVYGKHVRDWCSQESKVDDAQLAWEGENEFTKQRDNMKIRLYQSVWTNPNPDKRIDSLDLISFHDKTPCGPFCVALTAEGP